MPKTAIHAAVSFINQYAVPSTNDAPMTVILVPNALSWNFSLAYWIAADNAAPTIGIAKKSVSLLKSI